MAAQAMYRIGYGQVEPNKLIGIKTGDIHNMLPLDDSEDFGVNILQNGEFMYYDYTNGKVTCNRDDENVISVPYMVWNEIKIYEDWLSLKDFAMIRVGENYVTNNPAIGRLTSANIDGTVYGDGALTTSTEYKYPERVDSEGNIIPTIFKDTDIESTDKIDRQHTNYGYRMDGIVPRMLGTYVGDVMTTNMVYIKAGYTFDNDDTSATYHRGTILGLHKTDRNTLELCPISDDDQGKKIQYAVVKVYTMPDGQPGLKLQRIA